MFTPLVSVVVTTKNEESKLEDLLKSIQWQTYKKIETIIVDNNSEDNTLVVAKKYTPLVYSKGPERSIQRNFGAGKARGKYIVFLDADMQLSPRVIEDCVKVAETTGAKAVVIPERTIGKGFVPKIRRFEREMYLGDSTVELARFFDRKVFFEFGGYDEKLTGPEDYDLAYRVGKKYETGRGRKFLFHNEEGLTLGRLLAKKFYYASKGALYAKKHPELVATQGTILFRKAYLRNWRRFADHPILGLSFICVRALETIAAILGFIRAMGFSGFVRAFIKMISGQEKVNAA